MSKPLTDREKVILRQGSFELKESHAYKLFKLKVGYIPKTRELLKFPHFFSQKTGVKFERDDRRRKSTIFKVFEVHLGVFKDTLDRLSFCDSKHIFYVLICEEQSFLVIYYYLFIPYQQLRSNERCCS